MIPLIFLASALAEDPPDEEMIIEAQQTPEEARQALDEMMAGLGYKAGKARRNGRTVYKPSAWRGRDSLMPTLIVDEDGFVIIQGGNRRTVSNTWSGNYRRQQQVITEVFEALHPSITAWREAIQREVMEERYYNLPDQLAATWETGAPLGMHPGGARPEDRRAALLAFWVSRTDTPEGARVRQITADFISYVVQRSPWPVTPEEQAAAEAACQCGPLLP